MILLSLGVVDSGVETVQIESTGKNRVGIRYLVTSL